MHRDPKLNESAPFSQLGRQFFSLSSDFFCAGYTVYFESELNDYGHNPRSLDHGYPWLSMADTDGSAMLSTQVQTAASRACHPSVSEDVFPDGVEIC